MKTWESSTASCCTTAGSGQNPANLGGLSLMSLTVMDRVAEPVSGGVPGCDN